MRIHALHLLAFGPFEDRTLDFSAKPNALTVVFGRNEAGKSTSLRALEGLLFGIESTQDAHKHPAPNLRVGGTIVTAAGEELRFVRRRGKKGTLRDDDDQVIDDAPLKRVLRGVDRELFKTLYGLDHQRLREGAKALLSVKSSLAESLFEAGLSGAGVARLLASLREASEEIFVPLGKKRSLNEALRSFTDARKHAREFATAPSKYEEQVGGIERARERRAKAEEQLRTVERAMRRLERGLRVAPLVLARRALQRKRVALGEVVLLPANAPDERERALARREEAEGALRALETRRTELRIEIAKSSAGNLPIDPTDAIQTLSQLAGACRDEGRRHELREERDALVSRYDDSSRPRLAPIDDDLARAILDAVTARDAAEPLLERSLAELAELIAAAKGLAVGSSASSSDGLDLEHLRVALGDAERALGRLGDRRDVGRRAEDLGAAALRVYTSVGSTLSRELLACVRIPTAEEIDEWSNAYAEAIADRDREERAHRDAEERRVRLVRERAGVLEKGEIATEAELEAARRSRDAALLSLGTKPKETSLDEVVTWMRRADALADRMRSEAERSASLRRIDASLAELEVSSQRAEATARDARARADAQTRRANDVMGAVGAPALDDPRAHAGFLSRLRAFCEAEIAAQHALASLSSLDREIETATENLCRALPEASPTDSVALADLVAKARARVAHETRVATDRERGAAKLEELRLSLGKVQARVDVARTRAAAARDAAATALGHLDLDPAASKDTVREAIQRRKDAADGRARLARIDLQLARIDESERRLAEYCDTLAAALGREDIAGLPILRAEMLLHELRIAERAQKQLVELELRLGETETRWRDAEGRRATAETDLASYIARASAPDAEALPLAERRSAEARALDADIARHEGLITAAGDGAGLDELDAEYGAFDVEQAEVEQERLEGEREALEREKDLAAKERASIEVGLPKYEESQAAEYAASAQLHLARARTLALKYTKLKLASVVLEREIENYRRLHQGPVLAGAERHLDRLTRGNIRELRVVLGDRDQPELVCVRGGQEVPIDGLSDGAKDQLFLALRLSTIERHSENVESLPLVLDDILVNFDEDRSKAALEVLAGIAPRMQVLLFTHHERVVELAREATPGVQVVEL
ncbi:MAG: AAA family ATPase [Polyangiaceae bacterium]|nr:AAA family ATPase [Polyangiaceae bacterium]